MVRPSPGAEVSQAAQQNGQRPEARTAGARGGEGAAASPAADAETTARGAASLLSSISGSAGAVFAGKLNVFAVPDLMEFLRGARRTGTLLCTSAAGTATLRFRDGRIAGAASPATLRSSARTPLRPKQSRCG